MTNYTNTLEATYGGNQTPCEIFVYDGWYVVDGSVNVNRAADPELLVDGVDIETLEDCDTYTAADPITSESELETFIDNDGEPEETLQNVTLSIEISGGGVALVEENNTGKELARMLRKLADKLESSDSSCGGAIKDLNGNTAGEWDLELDYS